MLSLAALLLSNPLASCQRPASSSLAPRLSLCPASSSSSHPSVHRCLLHGTRLRRTCGAWCCQACTAAPVSVTYLACPLLPQIAFQGVYLLTPEPEGYHLRPRSPPRGRSAAGRTAAQALAQALGSPRGLRAYDDAVRGPFQPLLPSMVDAGKAEPLTEALSPKGGAACHVALYMYCGLTGYRCTAAWCSRWCRKCSEAVQLPVMGT